MLACCFALTLSLKNHANMFTQVFPETNCNLLKTLFGNEYESCVLKDYENLRTWENFDHDIMLKTVGCLDCFCSSDNAD
jgi:hypothetical protein